MEKLTKAQQELFNWLVDFIDENHYSPSMKKMMRAMNLRSPASVQSRLGHLRDKGYIAWNGETGDIYILSPTEAEPPLTQQSTSTVAQAEVEQRTNSSEQPEATKKTPQILYRECTGQFFPEDRLKLEPGQTPLEMVYIPPGSFLMGSPKDELRRYNDEGPQHEVTISEPFFMGKYPITQAQWRAVAVLPQIERELEPNPSNFEGDNRPVEQITWYNAVEFCARLAKATCRPYRLPSEAEWEYACRAGTTTPFHFGSSITTDLANYRGQDMEYEGKTYPGNYGNGPHGEFREQTTDVGSFEGSNAFGLYDMHGNVLEWCQERWRENYEGAPNDGSAWSTPPKDEEEERRCLRGGSWSLNPGNCRSATRGRLAPSGRLSFLSLRVVCAIART